MSCKLLRKIGTYERDRLAERLSVFDEFMTLQSEVLGAFSFLHIRYGEDDDDVPDDEEMAWGERIVELNRVVDRAVDTAYQLDATGRSVPLIKGLMTNTLLLMASENESLVKNLDPKDRKELEKIGKSGATVALFRIRHELRTWMEEVQMGTPLDR